jgi:hypothetical protein
MKLQTLLLFLILFASFTVTGQDNVDNKVVGFGCYYEGRQTKPVVKFNNLIRNNNYKAISKALRSSNNAERYLAVITLERLSESGKYTLTPKEQTLINNIKTSSDLVSVCSGCTYFDTITLKDAFSSQMHMFSKSWLDYNLNGVGGQN